jgi:predicted RNA-binding Zn ribbon-like protein
MDDDLDAKRQRMMRAMPSVSEEKLLEDAVDVFANRAQWPQAFLRIRGIPSMAQSAALEERTVMLMVKGHEEWEALRAEFRANLGAIVAGKVTRPLRKEITEQANRVTIRLKGGQRTMRPRDLEVPDLQAALGYVLHLMLTRQYGHRLGTCKLAGCGNFFFHQPRRGQPERYCSQECYKTANEQAAAARARDYRARKESIALLGKRWPASAASLVQAVKKPGLTVDELVARAVEHHAARKHK